MYQLNVFLLPLGTYIRHTVLISLSGDVVVSVTYPTAPLHPVQLKLGLQEVDGPGSSVIISSTSYMESTMVYTVHSSIIPYDYFRVNVSLVSNNVMGPTIQDSTIIYYGM